MRPIREGAGRRVGPCGPVKGAIRRRHRIAEWAENGGHRVTTTMNTGVLFREIPAAGGRDRVYPRIGRQGATLLKSPKKRDFRNVPLVSYNKRGKNYLARA
ncbi:MAG: hypothetical protein JWP91_4149 [Fibrobacteres bacterium]|nr:hypothetical protein [Fibrobacterota bacterium]